MSTEFYFPLKKEQLLEKPSDNRYWIEEQIDIEDTDLKKQRELLETLFTTIESDPKLITQQDNFVILFSFMRYFETLQVSTKNFLIDSYLRVIKNFVRAQENYLEVQDASTSGQWRNCLKIIVFFTEWIVESYLNNSKTKKKEIKKGRRKMKGEANKENDKNKTKSKRKAKGVLDSASKKDLDINIGAKEEITALNPESILKSLMRIVTSNIKVLFRNKIVDEDLMNSLIKICFDILEISNENKTVQNKEKIFEILQILITKYQSNANVQIILIKLTTKIVNLIYNQEGLVNYLSDFVVLAINGDSNMNKLAVDIIHEMSKTIFEDENFDSQGLKNVGKFLIILSEKSPKTIYNNISSLLRLFDSESYVIRNTLVEVISNVIIKILCNLDDIPEVDTRNNYLKTKEKFIDILFDRIYDKSGYCRSKVLQIFEKLADNNTISVVNYNKLLKEASGRLKDEKAHVRKRAISLISRIIVIYATIFKCDRFLTYEEISSVMETSNQNVEEHSKKIKLIENSLLEISNKYNADNNNNNDDEEDTGRRSPVIRMDREPNETDLIRGDELVNEKNTLREEINKEQSILDYFYSYKNVLKSIDNIIPLSIQLLGSKSVSDVQETIDLFVVLHKLRISSSFHGVKKMLNLIMKPEENIRKKLIEAYQQIYFNSEKPLDLQAAYLVELTVNLNFSEFTCLRELLKNLISSNSINMNIFKEIWKILIKNPDTEINKMKITSQEELHKKLNGLVIESRAALQILNIASDYDASVLLNNSDIYIKNIFSNLQKKKIDWLLIKECIVGLQKIYAVKRDVVELSLVKISKTIIKGYGTEDNNWYIATQELVDTIFQVVSNPERISQYLIIKLSRPLFASKLNKTETEEHFATQNIDSAPKFTNSQGMEVDNAPPSNNETENELNPLKLSQLIFIVGHVALNMVVYAEKLESNLKKKKNEKSPSKDKSVDDIQEIAGGKEAEIEYDINLLHKIVEEEILYKNLLGKFAPLIVEIAHRILICDDAEMEKNLFLYKSSILSLCKFMCISQKFCEDNLPFLFDLLNCDFIDPSLKLNICAAFGDFINRFPNILQKQVSKFFTCLHSKNSQVVRYSMTVISHLVLNDMLKLKGEVVDICMLLESEDNKIKDLINLFFYELNQKGNNVIYNVIPKALAKLSNEYKHLEYDRFKNIVRNLLKYVEKDKHTEGLIDKLSVKLKNSIDIVEWRNTTYCLSLLNYNDKHITKLLEFYNNLKDKIEDDDIVKENFQNIFTKYKKGANTNKEAIEELEKKFFAGEKMTIAAKAGKKSSNDVVNKPKKRTGVKRNYSKMKNNNMDDDSSVGSESVASSSIKSNIKPIERNNNIAPNNNFRSATTRDKNKTKKIIVEDDSEDDDYQGDSDF